MRFFLRRRNFEQEMTDELAAHVQHRADDLVAAGQPPADALRQARVELGAVETYKEDIRDERLFGRARRFFEQSGRDLKLALRRLRTAPGYALFAMASIGVGAGITIAIYSIVSASLWTKSPVSDPNTVMLVVTHTGARAWDNAIALGDFHDFRQAQKSFATLDASAHFFQSIAGDDGPQLAQGEGVTANYFQTLGLAPSLGRLLGSTDDEPSAPGTVVLSYQLWRSRFASDRGVIGRSVLIAGQPFEVVGVAPRPYRGINIQMQRTTSFYVSLSALKRIPSFDAKALTIAEHVGHSVSIVGRLKPGVSMAAASAEAATFGAGLDAEFPGSAMAWFSTSAGREARPSTRAWTAEQITDAQKENAPVRSIGVIVISIVALVLAVACTNLANLTLARGTSREQELAVRLALGASRGRLVRELLAESILIGLGGLAVSLLVGPMLMTLGSIDLPITNAGAIDFDAHLNLPAFLMAVAAVSLSVMVCGLWPALKLSRGDVRTMISAGGTTGTPPWRGQLSLIRAQVAVSVAFFSVTGVLVSALVVPIRQDAGIDLNDITVARTEFRLQKWDEARSRRAIDAIASIPPLSFHAQQVAVSSSLPFGATTYVFAKLAAPEQSFSTRRDATLLMAATPSIFSVLGVPIVKGRAFDARDSAGALPVIVLSELEARRQFGTTDVIGRTLKMVGDINASDRTTIETRTVIGISRDTDVDVLTHRKEGLAYVPIAQRFEMTSFVIARNAGGESASLRSLIAAADPDVAVAASGSGLVMLAGGWVAAAILATVAFLLGSMTLVLTMTGLVGLLSHVVVRRSREIAIRRSLGADDRAIRRMVMRDGIRPVASGSLVGLFIGALLGFAVRAGMPVGAAPMQPVAMLIVLVTLVPSTLIACYLPARKALRVDANVALKGF